MWLSHLGFYLIVEKAWDGSPTLNHAISSFVKAAILWNREVFGNIFSRKKKILARLNGAQNAIATRPSAFLLSLEKELSSEYTEILNQEEEFWALKAHLNWQLQGDRNTTFFQAKMIIRRKANRIDRLKNRLRDWLDSEQQVINHIQDGFQELYKSQHLSSIAHSDFDVD